MLYEKKIIAVGLGAFAIGSVLFTPQIILADVVFPVSITCNVFYDAPVSNVILYQTLSGVFVSLYSDYYQGTGTVETINYDPANGAWTGSSIPSSCDHALTSQGGSGFSFAVFGTSASDVAAVVGANMTSIWIFILLALGIPLSFYIIERVIKIFPSDRKK